MELEQKQGEFESRGIRVAAISYDDVEILKNFSDRAGITFPLLADPRIEIIKAFGILNTDVPRDDPYYGFAYAGWYLLDENGKVHSKYFNEENNDRFTSSNILIREFQDLPEGVQGQAETGHLSLTWLASNPAMRAGQRLALILKVKLKPHMHVYSPEVKGYIPIQWSVKQPESVVIYPAEYPEARMMSLPAISETVPVYQDSFTILRDIRIDGHRNLPPSLQGKEKLTVEGAFTYQACDLRQCYPPVTIPLKWAFRIEEHDHVRVPEALQRAKRP